MPDLTAGLGDLCAEICVIDKFSGDKCAAHEPNADYTPNIRLIVNYGLVRRRRLLMDATQTGQAFLKDISTLLELQACRP